MTISIADILGKEGSTLRERRRDILTGFVPVEYAFGAAAVVAAAVILLTARGGYIGYLNAPGDDFAIVAIWIAIGIVKWLLGFMVLGAAIVLLVTVISLPFLFLSALYEDKLDVFLEESDR